MRTTITLGSDVVALVNKLMAERGLSFKNAVNATLRNALAPERVDHDHRFPTSALGTPIVPLDRALQLAAALEDEEIVRELKTGR